MQSIYRIGEIVLYVNDKVVVIVICLTEWNLRRKKKITKKIQKKYLSMYAKQTQSQIPISIFDDSTRKKEFLIKNDFLKHKA